MEHVLVSVPLHKKQAETALQVTVLSGEELQRSNGHHQEITQAMEVGDGNWAEAVMVSHIHSAMQTYRRTFRQQSAAE